MKRILVVALSLVLCLSCFSFAFAEGIETEVGKLTDELLVNLYNVVKDEMTKRGLLEQKSYTLPTGKYIIGQDIMPGKYTLTCTETSGEDLGNAYSSLGNMFGSLGGDSGYGDLMGSLGGMMNDLIKAQVSIIGDYGTVIKSYELDKGQSVEITLEEKTALQIEEGSCSLEPAK